MLHLDAKTTGPLGRGADPPDPSLATGFLLPQYQPSTTSTSRLNGARSNRPRSTDSVACAMDDKTGNRFQSGDPGNNDGEQTLSGREILMILAVIALVCVGGYFFLMKLIAVSRQEDCFLAQRKNCVQTEPFGR
ncbi:MAG TPA: hypothetical protein VFL55_04170 [Acetobacteraceae bacterium]|nr:hypothetical protein [Acetobacteraceae bacterium]